MIVVSMAKVSVKKPKEIPLNYKIDIDLGHPNPDWVIRLTRRLLFKEFIHKNEYKFD